MLVFATPLKQWSVSFSVCQNHVEGLLKCTALDLTREILILGWGSKICSNKFLLHAASA